MYKVTDRRFQKAESILEEYRDSLNKNLDYDTHAFEMELRNCWDVGYQEIKDLLIDLIKKHPRYKHLALYYMQFQNAPGPVCEFHETLAKEYGAENYYSDEFEQKKDRFWEIFKKAAKKEK